MRLLRVFPREVSVNGCFSFSGEGLISSCTLLISLLVVAGFFWGGGGGGTVCAE